jgi:hypothetical protein
MIIKLTVTVVVEDEFILDETDVVPFIKGGVAFQLSKMQRNGEIAAYDVEEEKI